MTPEPAAVAFLQLDAQTFACVEGPLAPVAAPPSNAAALLAPHFSLDPRHGWWWGSEGAVVRRMDRAEWSARFPPACDALAPLPWELPEEARFRSAFDNLSERLRTGRLRKGVPITRMRARLADDEAERWFRRLLARVPSLPASVIAYGVFLPAAAGRGPEFVVGATPELLFEAFTDGRVRTSAVAGTRLAAPGAEADLASSEKDGAEHLEVVDDLLAQARHWGTPRAGLTAARQFGGLVHLVTEIDVEPRTRPDFEGLVRALHPTPALGAAPRGAEAAAWLRGIDPAGDRRRFGAPFGIRWPGGEGRAAVAIRSLQCSGGHVEIWAGCGVVAASEDEAEWSEILQKMEAVRSLWGV